MPGDVSDALLRLLARRRRARQRISSSCPSSAARFPRRCFCFLRAFRSRWSRTSFARRASRPTKSRARRFCAAGKSFFSACFSVCRNFCSASPAAPWTDLLRVDVLNVIGVSLMMMGVACRIAAAGGAAGRRGNCGERRSSTAIVCAAAIAIFTPPLWTTWRPHWLAWWLESYINGVHTFGKPQPWLFPIFPWAAFAFAGLAVGSLLLSDWARRKEAAGACPGRAERDRAHRAGTVAGRAARATLCGLRFLAHQPEFLSGSRGSRAGHSLFGLRVVPLGSQASGVSVR